MECSQQIVSAQKLTLRVNRRSRPASREQHIKAAAEQLVQHD